LDHLIKGYEDFQGNHTNPKFTGHYFMKICRNALKSANELLASKVSSKKAKKLRLQNVWDHLAFSEPLGAYHDYIQSKEKGEDKYERKPKFVKN
jgi:hypothetical protein